MDPLNLSNSRLAGSGSKGAILIMVLAVRFICIYFVLQNTEGEKLIQLTEGERLKVTVLIFLSSYEINPDK
jgi:hypothetical protein